MMGKTRWTGSVQNEVLHRVKEEKEHSTHNKWGKIGHNLLMNCLLKHVIEEKIRDRVEVMRRRGRRRKQILYDLKEKRGS
jgi:hypothetical protein